MATAQDPASHHDVGDLLPRSIANIKSARHSIQTTPLTLRNLPTPRYSQVFALLRGIVSALLPDIVRREFVHQPAKKQRLTDSSWMDGLRGIAAFAVFNHHFFEAYSRFTRIGFGHDENHMQPLSLPLIRLAFEGTTAVCIFFAISGYVVSKGTLRSLGNGQTQQVLPNLSRSVFRRGFRLYLPMLCIMLITALSAHFGIFEYSRPLMNDPSELKPPGFHTEANLKRFGRLKWQLSFLFKEFWINTNILEEGQFFSKHDAHLWTLRFEYRGSILIYVALVGMSGCRPIVRCVGLCALGFIQLTLNRWDLPLFFVGAALAQLSVLRQRKSTSSLPLSQLELEACGGGSSLNSKSTAEQLGRSCRQPLWIRVTRFCLFGLCLWLMSFPPNDWKQPAPGYFWIHSLIPWWFQSKQRFPRIVGTSALIYLLDTVPDQRRSTWMNILNSRPAQYFGRVMFSLYLVHGPVLHMIGFALARLIWVRIGWETYWPWVAGVTGGWFLSLLMCLWAAEVFEREIIGRCNSFTKWLEEVCFVKSPKEESEKSTNLS